MEDYITTIAIKTSTKRRIAKHGTKGETFDHILNIILDEVEQPEEEFREPNPEDYDTG